MPKLTKEQSAALDCRKHSVALSAGAGCGKTFVLTERFLSHLDTTNYADAKNTRLGQLIAITFTDAAAREMRSRIRRACFDKLQLADTTESQESWLRHLREIDAARISTIHAFCTSLLRASAAQAGLDPAFGVMDQSEADVLQFDVIDDVLREQLSQLDENTLDLASNFGLQYLKQQITELLGHRYDESFGRWQTATANELIAKWSEWHTVYGVPNAVAEIASAAPIGELFRLLHSLQVPPKKDKLRDAKAALLDLLPRLQSADTSLGETHLLQIRELAKVQGVCTAKDWPGGEYDEYKNACSELRGLIDKHLPKPFSKDAAQETARLGLELLKLTAKVVSVYDDRKRDQGKLDFDDLLAKAHALLHNADHVDLQERLADDLRLLLIDEFQDTDRLQVELVKKICGPGFETGHLFFVGDFKQSIYRFRGAAPDVFRNLRGQIHEKGRLPLTVNFRSQPEILHFVNALFCETFGGGDNTYEPLQPSRDQATQAPAIEFLWTITPDKNKTYQAGEKDKARREEAKAIARRLSALLDPACNEFPAVDKETKKARQLKPADVAILFRTLSDVQVYEEALREYGLDYYLVGGHAFYAQQEIFDVLNLLRAVASAADEVSLAGVLRSPFFSLADETLFWLADSGDSLNAGLLAESPPQQLSPEEAAKVTAAAATIAHLRSIKDRVPIAALLNAALDRTGYDAILVAEFLGERKLANLNKLVERARVADQNGTTDLDGFITQLSQFVAREPKESLAATLPEAANIIRLMTIHHAKGLEFPFVVVPDLDRQPLLRSPSAALHPDLGPLVPQPSDDENEKVTTGMTLFAALERRDELEERKRMLYVACTRAADYLMLSTSLEAYDKPKSDWMNLIAERFNLQSGECTADLPNGYTKPQVRVTSDPQTGAKPIGKSHGPDLLKLLEDAHELAARGLATIPREVAPVPADATAQHQFSFSRLTGQLIRPHHSRGHSVEPPTAPGSAGGSMGSTTPETDARGLGTLVHDVLERIDFARPDDIAAWCEHLAPSHVIQNTEHAAQLACDMIERFTKSARGRELATATAVHREIDFLLAWPPGETNSTGRYIQGVIDCLYQDPTSGWHIADFKTNDVTAAKVSREAQQYELQLHVYAIAIERTLGQSPKELVLHFLRPGAEHIIPWNDAARKRAIAKVNELIVDAMEPSNELLVSASV
jgi:ATP-dependent helicase/nuclease subunit A